MCWCWLRNAKHTVVPRQLLVKWAVIVGVHRNRRVTVFSYLTEFCHETVFLIVQVKDLRNKLTTTIHYKSQIFYVTLLEVLVINK